MRYVGIALIAAIFIVASAIGFAGQDLDKYLPSVDGFQALELPPMVAAMGGPPTRIYQKMGERGKQVTVSIVPKGTPAGGMAQMPPPDAKGAYAGEKIRIQGRDAYLRTEQSQLIILAIVLKNGAVGISSSGFASQDVVKAFASKLDLNAIENAIGK